MIAVHAAMYVFQSTSATTEAGLYNYRYIAYTCWIIYPVLMASLAFTNPMSPYLSSGTICTLPVRPFWYRLALSWIPRYIIIFAIVSLYVAIYVYVHFKFKGIDGESTGSYNFHFKDSRSSIKAVETNEGIVIPAIRTRPSATPHVHNLLHEFGPRAESELNSKPGEQRFPSKASTPAWECYNFGGSHPVSPLPEGTSTLGVPSSEHRISTTSAGTNGEAVRNLFNPTTSSHTNSNYYVIEALRDSRNKSFTPGQGSTAEPTSKAPDTGQPDIDSTNGLTPPMLHDMQPAPVGTSSLRKRHKDIKRKLRLLFIYPIVYVAMWLIPFTFHCLLYTERYSANPPYPLTVLAVMCLALQGAVDSLLFSSREKPWRYIGQGRFLPWGKAPSRGRLRRSSGGSILQESAEFAEGKDEENGQSNSRAARSAPTKGHGQHWWDIEGRMRMDSVMLGTDHSCDEHGGRPSQGTISRRSPIEEEEEPSLAEQRRDLNLKSGRRGYGGLHRGEKSHHGSKGWYASRRASRISEDGQFVDLGEQGRAGVPDVEKGRQTSLGLPAEQERSRSLRLPSSVPGRPGHLGIYTDIPDRRGSLGSHASNPGRRGSAVTFTEDTNQGT